MIKPGGAMQINGEEYQCVGDVEFYRRQGDSSTRFQLHGVQRLSDGQRYYVADLYDYGGQPEILVAASEVTPAQGEWELLSSGKQWRVTDAAFESIPRGQYLARRYRGLGPDATAGLAPPMAGARTRITLENADDGSQPPVHLYGRDLLKGVDDEHYTDDTPASAVDQKSVERHRVTPAIFGWLSMVLVLAVAGLVALDLKVKVHPHFDYVKLYWYLGLGSIVALFLRRRYPFRAAFYLFATAFLLYFQTLFIEYLLGVTQSTSGWNIEGLRIAGILVVLVVLDKVHPKSFSVIAHAALFSGLISLFLYSCGFAFYGCSSGNWTSYRQHVGGLPHGYVWILVFMGFLIYRIRDYRLVPVKFEGVLALHRKMEQGFEGTLAVVHKRAAALAHMADDFGDAMMVSNDPRMGSILNIHQRYTALSKMMKDFGKIDLERIVDPQLAEHDLATLREDLRALGENIARANQSEQLSGLRLSPHILAASRSGDRKP